MGRVFNGVLRIIVPSCAAFQIYLCRYCAGGTVATPTAQIFKELTGIKITEEPLLQRERIKDTI